MIRVAVVAPRAVVRKRITASLSAGEVTVIGEADCLDDEWDWSALDSLDVLVVDGPPVREEYSSGLSAAGLSG